jgi:hypothetical protein
MNVKCRRHRLVRRLTGRCDQPLPNRLIGDLTRGQWMARLAKYLHRCLEVGHSQTIARSTVSRPSLLPQDHWCLLTSRRPTAR